MAGKNAMNDVMLCMTERERQISDITFEKKYFLCFG